MIGKTSNIIYFSIFSVYSHTAIEQTCNYDRQSIGYSQYILSIFSIIIILQLNTITIVKTLDSVYSQYTPILQLNAIMIGKTLDTSVYSQYILSILQLRTNIIIIMSRVNEYACVVIGYFSIFSVYYN